MERPVGGRRIRPWFLALAGIALAMGLASSVTVYWVRLSRPIQEADGHWRQAQEAIAEREFAQAAAHLTHCLEIWPLNSETHFLMARTCRRAGQLNRWKKHLDRAEVLHWPQSQIDLERKLRRAQVGDVWQVEDFLMDRLNERTPDEVIILEALVNGYLQNDRLADVIAFTSTWSNRFPEDWLPLIYHGNASLRLHGKASDARKDFERVLELKPDHPEAHFSLAIVLTDQGDFKEALPHFQYCLDSQVDDPTGALYGLANCQFSLGRSAQARDTLERLLAQSPNHAAGMYLQAKIELAEGRREEALQFLKKADSLSPDEADVTNSLLVVSRQLQHEKEAEVYARRMERIRQRDAELDRLLTELKDQPDDPDLRLQLAMLCLKLGREQEASHWFQGILWKNPNHVPTLKALSDYYESKGNRKMADHYRRLAEKVGGPVKAKPIQSSRPKSDGLGWQYVLPCLGGTP